LEGKKLLIFATSRKKAKEGILSKLLALSWVFQEKKNRDLKQGGGLPPHIT